MGKYRVAPIRNMTVAKLEMQAAVFGVRLRELILGEHDFEIDRIIHWTDSTTVLQWLHASNNKQQVIVANRVAEVLDNSTIDQWRPFEGKLNPADVRTRGMTVEALTKVSGSQGRRGSPRQKTPGLSHGSCGNGTSIQMGKIWVFQENDSSAVILP